MLKLTDSNYNSVLCTPKEPKYFLGIDGGGTKTAFKLVDKNDNVISILYKGATNPNDIGFSNSLFVLREGITEICSDKPYASISLFAGISGSSNYPGFREFFESFGFYSFDCGSDIENLISLTECNKRVLVIMGTGFVTFAINNNEKFRISGWGQLFDDGGCGFTLGRDAISASLNEIDGSGEKTLITKLIEEKTGERTQHHLNKFYEGGKKYIAEFAETVFSAYTKNDKIAEEILNKNLSFAASKINTALMKLSTDNNETIPIYFAGGLINRKAVIFPILEKLLPIGKCRLLAIELSPVDGAVKRAKLISELI